MWKEEFRGLHLIKVLLQDQVLYFIVYESFLLIHDAVLMIYETSAIFCAVVNLIESVVDLGTILGNTFSTLGNPSLLCVLGSHLLIHLREAADEDRNERLSYRSKSFSAIEFGQGEVLSEHGRRDRFDIAAR